MKRFPAAFDKTAKRFISSSTIRYYLEQNTGDYALEYKLKHVHVIMKRKGKQCF